jgi:hypothetical protein
VFVDRDDNPNVDTMQWPSVLMAAAVQPTSNISVWNSDGSLQPLGAAASSVVNTSSVLQLRVTSEIGSISDVRVTIHAVSHLEFRCSGSRNPSDLVPVGVVSESPIDCVIQTPSNVKAIAGGIALRIQLIAENGRWLKDVATLTAASGANLWASVSFESPSLVAAGKTFTVGFSLSGQAAHQFMAPSNVTFALLDLPLWSMQQRGLNGTGGTTGGFVNIQRSLRGRELNYSSVMGDMYDVLELRMMMHSIDELVLFHENDAFAAQQREEDETRRQMLFANDPVQLALSRNEDPRDAQQLKSPNSTLFVRLLTGRNQLKMHWLQLGSVTLHVWNGIDVAPPVAQLTLYTSRRDRNVMQGSSLQLGTQLLSLDPRTRLEDLSYEWSSPSHPQLQLIGGARPGSAPSGNSSSHVGLGMSPSAGELWVDGTLLSTPGSYTFSVLVTDRQPGRRSSKDGGPVAASASISVTVLSRRDFLALGCEFTRDELTGLCIPCPQGASCPGGQSSAQQTRNHTDFAQCRVSDPCFVSCVCVCVCVCVYSSGGRAWPLPGWWSVDEWSTPISCRMPEACLGVDLTAAQAPPPSGNGTQGPVDPTDTQRCALGYTGRTCVQCASGFYQVDAGACFTCGSTTDQSREVSTARNFWQGHERLALLEWSRKLTNLRCLYPTPCMSLVCR